MQNQQQRLFEEEQQRNFNEIQNQQMFDDYNRWAMEETIKAGTPFDEGGYMQGYVLTHLIRWRKMPTINFRSKSSYNSQ
jgi:hypothetical protein